MFRLNDFVGKRVLVTGDTGFKGSWLCAWLVELKAEVTGFALPPVSESRLFPEVAPLIRHVDGDIRDLPAVLKVMSEARPEVVFHLAAQPLVLRSYVEPQVTFATNLLGSVNLLEAVRVTESVRSLVLITTDKVYRNRESLRGYQEDDELGGNDPYSASKAAAELAFHAYSYSYFANRAGLGAASVRAGNVIGGGDRSAYRIVPDAIAALEAGKPIVLRNPASVRPWQHVLDPLFGYLQLAVALLQEPRRFSGSWNFGPAKDHIRSVEDLVRVVTATWAAGEIIHANDANPRHETGLLVLASEKAKRELGWEALWPFERAAAETARWYKAVHGGTSPLAIAREQIASYMAERSKP
jgi:CDP-glucose 4,6-dehydratase